MSSRRPPSELYGHDILVPKLSDGLIERVSELDPPQLPDYISSDRSSVDLYGHDIMAPPIPERRKGNNGSGSGADESPLVRSMKSSSQREGSANMDPALDSADSRKEIARSPRAKSPMSVPVLPLQNMLLGSNQHTDLRASSPAVTKVSFQLARNLYPSSFFLYRFVTFSYVVDLTLTNLYDNIMNLQWMTEPAGPVISLTPRTPVAELPKEVREAIGRVGEVTRRQSFLFLDGRPQGESTVSFQLILVHFFRSLSVIHSNHSSSYF